MNDEVIVSVKDNGIGMTPELLRRAFEIFDKAQEVLRAQKEGWDSDFDLLKARSCVSTVLLPPTVQAPIEEASSWAACLASKGK